MKSNRARKCFSCTKGGMKQQELGKYFRISLSKRAETVSKIVVEKEKCNNARKKLFNDEIIAIVDDEESVLKKEVLEESECTTVQISNLSLRWKHSKVSVAGTSGSLTTVEVARIIGEQRNIVTLNKPVKQMASPQKVKPRVLQSVSTTTNNSDVVASTSSSVYVYNNKSLSQNSGSSEDTIIYDPFEQNDIFYHSSPTSRLIRKVNENVQATKLSSVAYRKADFAFLGEVAGGPEKMSETSAQLEESELTNPRAVNFVTKIVKYVFMQPHLKSLFNEEEVRTIERFFSLPLPEYNYFCYKLYTRLPRWYNVFKLCETIRLYMDTNEILSMRECLQRNGFVFTDYSSEPVEQLLNLLNVKELREIRNSFRLKAKIGKKSQLIDCLLENCSKQTTLTLSKNSNQILRDRISEKLGPCIKLSDKLYDLFYRIHLLYALGSSEFSKAFNLYQFIDSIENGIIILPEKFIDTAPLFASRDEFLEFAKASEYKDELLNAVDTKNRDTMVEISRVAYKNFQDILNRDIKLETKPSYLLRFTAGAKYASLLNIAVKHLTATHQNEVKEWLNLLLNQKLYCQHKKGLWYDQLVMMETKYFSNYEMGVQLLIKALKDKSISQIALHDLSMRGRAIKKNKKYNLAQYYIDKLSSLIVEPPDIQPFPSIVIEAKALRGNESGRKRTYIETTNNSDQYLTGVEQIALNHYKRNGFPKGFHCEGSLLITLFFVLFWDIIYNTKVPSAFINEIQYIPLDLYSEEFYKNRKSDIDQRLIEIRDGWDLDELFLFINQNWENHSYKRSLIVQDLVENADELTQIVRCIGRECLSTLLERLVRDFKQFHSGLPDLFVWNIEENKCRFVEVKGEKDKLSMKQRVWLNYLRSAEADIHVCHVHSIGSKPTAKIAKLREGLVLGE